MVVHSLVYWNQFYNRKKEKRVADLQYHFTEKNAEIVRWRRNSSSVTVKLMNEQLVSLRVCVYMYKGNLFPTSGRSARRGFCFGKYMHTLTNFHTNY